MDFAQFGAPWSGKEPERGERAWAGRLCTGRTERQKKGVSRTLE
jgi:hypothetical protein